MALLAIEKLTMRFGGLTAVSDVDAQIEPGQIFSLIGPNGAGKTTVFNAVTGIYEPTTGEIRFAGHPLRRPWTPRVIVAAILIGLFTATFAVCLAINMDSAWRATVVRSFKNSGAGFSLGDSLGELWNYVRGLPAVEREERDNWVVQTSDGQKTLAGGRQSSQILGIRGGEKTWTETFARDYRDDLAAAMRLTSAQRRPRESRGDWVIQAADGTRDLARYPTKIEAEKQAAVIEALADQGQTRSWAALLVGVLAFALGAAGSLVVWNRSRRAPEVIALYGLARTFQNIRLFQDMTVLENVLLGMDRGLKSGALAAIFRWPRWRREEDTARREALRLLDFFGLKDQAGALAKNLPYGDQRRLEIARALATRPQLLLLDEPAAGMNPAESAELTGLIRKIRDQGITILLIEHHMKVVMQISDCVAVLNYGSKIAEGTPAEVRSNSQVIEAYLGKEDVG